MLLRTAGCVAALIAAPFTTSSALRPCPVYPATISACCVADQPGQSYWVGTDLTATNSCIKISARNVSLYLNAYEIASSNSTVTGIGIHVLSTAPNALIEGVSGAGAGPSIISGFAIGIKTDATNTIVDGVTAASNNRGMVFNGKGVVGFNLSAVGSGKNGITLTPAASGSYLLGAQAQANGKNGILLRGTIGVTLSYPAADHNHGYGLWLKGASFNSVFGGELEGNGIAGLYLGCHADFTNATAGCAIPTSNENSIDGGPHANPLTVGSCPSGTQIDQPYGIVIDKGNGHNRVISVASDTNSSCLGSAGDTVYDGYDANGVRCRGNVWFFTALATENHYPPANFGCMD